MSHPEVLAVMLVAGLLGGTINFALSRTEHSTWRDWFWSTVVGLGASLLIPLFLNTISSSLLSGLLNGSSSSADIYVLAGFCLLGAIASKVMIQTLTQRLLREAAETRNEIRTLKEEVAPIVAKETETSGGTERPSIELRMFGTDPGVDKVLKALGSDKYTWRYFGGISEETRLPKAEIERALSWLLANRLVVETSGRQGKVWGLSPEGRDLLYSIVSAEKAGSG
jgi:hypothetical protein